ncbi:PAS domain-containing sensor histidine kinase [Spirosoma foliorum]|uniref:histidine kinase n=1 Tax=Spirosoma foliorum TaxID=2710596 RepID=A0A7G5GWD0_9BACT|nr:PAS domain S-box protein [Spirosoma foliorum]QMW03172.1 PAS domain S-box protein [Spirosoma foliorum]
MPDNTQTLPSADSLNQRLDVDFALEAAGLGVWELDLTTRQLKWDERCQRLFGLTKGRHLSYQEAIAFIHPDDLNRVDSAVNWALNPQSGGRYDVTYRTIGADDNQLRWVRFIGKSYFHQNGQVYKFAGVAQDVTRQMEDQQAIQESEQRFRLLADALPQAIWVTDPTGNVEFLNKWWANYSGVAFEPTTAWQVAADSLHPEDAPRLVATFQQAIQQGKGFAIEQRNRSASGEYHWFLNIGEPYRDTKTGQITKWVGMSIDIDDRKQAEEALRQSEGRLRAVLDSLVDGVYIGRQEGITLVNQAALDQLGYMSAQELNRNIATLANEIQTRDWQTGAFIPVEEQAFARALAGEYVIQDVLVRHRLSGQDRVVRCAASPVAINGQVVAAVAINTDVTEFRQSEEALRQSEARYRQLAQELETRVQTRTHELELLNQDLHRSNDSLQQFAYVASHDLQEPLRKIQQFSTLLSQYLGEGLDATAIDYLERITRSGARMSTLIRDLLSYSRITTRQQPFGPISLNAVVTGVLETLSVEVELRQAQIEVDELPIVNGDDSQLSQLFQNLLSNALKYTPASQRPQIRVEYVHRHLAELPAEVRPNRSAPFYHQISVIDQGIGFDTKYLDRIFQVFQRLHSKSEFPGTGVGLAICQRVMENHGGGITASSKPGQGATFYVYFPA